MIEAGIYIHIPFCKKKCFYCDFNSYTGYESLYYVYTDALKKEIALRKDTLFDTVSSIFIGGGTPNVLSAECIKEILYMIYRYFNVMSDAEITIELNPGLITEERLRIYQEIGINRISIGLQAWQNRLLKRIGRLHTIEEFIENYRISRKYFSNINIDLIYALPGQTFEDWKETLSKVVELKPKHISCYGFILEKDTVFYNLYIKGKLKMPSDDFEIDLFHYTIDFLQKCGYNHYEISNYAINSYECRHNILYWKDMQYIGFGAGAYSFDGDKRTGNIKGIKEYIEMINNKRIAIIEEEQLKKEDKMSEFMFLGLRMMEGVNDREFKHRFSKSMFLVYKDAINKNIDLNLLMREGDRVYLTLKGMDVSNNVFEDFLI
ncbi:MAG: radical SAM family heme chaperone HemW [Thermoanaerobacteraceae bacterium]|nr:radical SAM family heme chaperone HemW [Thermoanaerobacteraceae bacterium]